MANDIDRPRNQVAVYQAPAPQPVPNNPLDRALARFDARGRTATLNALTQQAEAGARYVDALAAGGRSLIAYMEVQAEIADLPAKIAHRAAVSLEYRKAEFEEAVHFRKLSHLRHEHAETLQETEIRRARLAQEDIDQQLEAQQKYGMGKYRLRHLQDYSEELGIEIDIDTKKRELAKVFGDEDKPTADVIAHLRAVREHLVAAGLATDQIDAAIESLK